MTLRRRGDAGTYQLVARVPKELRDSYGGKMQITESLGGFASQREAQRRHDIRLGEIQREFEKQLAELDGQPVYEREDLRSWARMAARRDIWLAPQPRPLSLLRDGLATAPRLAEDGADEFIGRRGLALPKDSDAYAYFLGCIRNYIEDQITLDIRVALGTAQPESQAVREPGKPAPEPPTVVDPDDKSNLGSAGQIALIQAITRYKQTPEWNRKSEKARLSYGQSLGLLCRQFGDDRHVHTLKPADFGLMHDLIARLPVQVPKKGALLDIIEKNERDGGENIAAGTRNRHVTAIRGLFKWLRKNWFIQFDPSENLGRWGDQQKHIKQPFTDDDVKKMFCGPGLHKGDKASMYYWVPLIGLHTGARKNEICQLQHADIVAIKGSWCFNITTDGENKSLKTGDNGGSKRIVPVHSNLIALGFLDFVADNRANPNGRLFRDVTYTSINKWAGKFDKTFHRRLGKVIERTDGNKVKGFHSFRHFVNDRLGDSLIDYGVIDALLGWSTEERRSVMRERYGDKDTPFAKLVEGIESLSYPWLPIPRPAAASSQKRQPETVVAE